MPRKLKHHFITKTATGYGIVRGDRDDEERYQHGVPLPDLNKKMATAIAFALDNAMDEGVEWGKRQAKSIVLGAIDQLDL